MKPLHLPLMALACLLATTQTHAESFAPSAPVCGYDYEGRLVKVQNPASSAAFDYRATTLDGEDYDAVLNISDPSIDISCFLVMGDNGLVESAKVIETAGDEFAELYTATFVYDADGRLTGISKDGFLGHKTTAINAKAADYSAQIAAVGVEMPYLLRAGLIDKTVAKASLPAADQSTIYDINGGAHNAPVKGLNITRHADGTSSKTLQR